MLPCKSPCLGCRDRHALCHDHCDRYQAFRQERMTHYAERAVARDVHDIRSEHYYRVMKKVRKKV